VRYIIYTNYNEYLYKLMLILFCSNGHRVDQFIYLFNEKFKIFYGRSSRANLMSPHKKKVSVGNENFKFVFLAIYHFNFATFTRHSLVMNTNVNGHLRST
jgi:hypothetical protein